jgi:hypothetical protein
MDIKEIRNEIVALEKSLSELLIEFEKQTDIKVEKVYVDRRAEDGWNKRITAHVICSID